MQDRVAIAPASEDADVVREILERARRRGFSRFVVGPATAFAFGDREEVARRDGQRLELSNGLSAVEIRKVADLAALEGLLDAAEDGGLLAVEWAGDRVIPLEWAVARRGRRFRLWTFARGPAEVPAALGALEHGADRVVVAIERPAQVDELEAVLDRPTPTALSWATLKVRSLRPAGLGDRVIVDTTSLLRPDEGLLVGSAAAFLFHVASEAVGSSFSRPRPFRVNAGSAHSYVLMADGTTRYLAELVPGDAVLVTAPDAASRSVRVGRIKVERRPLTIVRAEDGEKDRTVFVQEAETVRLSTDTGRLAVTDLAPGQSVRGVRLPAGRHLGAPVEETIEER